MPDSDRSKKVMMSDMVPLARPKKVAKVVQLPESISTPEYEESVRQPIRETYYQDSETASPKSGCGVWVLGFICTIALLLVIGGVFASTHITLIPKKFSGTVDLSPIFTQTNLIGGLQFFTATKIFTKEQLVPAETSLTKDIFATGTVRFYNTGAHVKNIPSKTILRASNQKGIEVSYQTQGSIIIPAGTVSKPGQKDVKVIAINPGSDSNIQLSDFIVETPSVSITARSVTEISGGSLSTDKSADPATITTAESQLINTIGSSDDFIKRTSLEIPDTMIPIQVAFVSQPQLSTESHNDGVHVIEQVTVTIVMVKRNELARYLGNFINTPNDLKVTLDNLDGLTITNSILATPTTIPQTLQVRITGTATIIGDINSKAIQKNILGMSRSNIKALIKAIPEIDSFSLKMMPFWRSIVPTDPQKVVIEVIH
jgi:hypothetical protein